jgi:hypothetical protein
MIGLRCIEDRGYQVTVGEIYQGVEEGRDFYRVTNDNDTSVRYIRAMFEVVEEVEEETVRQLNFDHLDFRNNIYVSNSEIRLTFEDSVMAAPSRQIARRNLLSVHVSHISCGIVEFFGINHLADLVANMVNTYITALRRLENTELQIEDFDITRMKEIVLERVITHFVRRESQNNRAIVLISTNQTDNNHYDLIDDVLTNLSENELTLNNPNSGNDITFWTLIVNDVLN